MVLLACAGPDDKSLEPDSPVEGLVVEPATVPTVLHARWTTAEPTRATVTGSFGDDAVTVAERADATDHDVLLLGLPAHTDVTVTVEVEGTRAVAEATTGGLPAWVPDLTYAADAPEASAGGYTVTSVVDLSGGGPLVLDAAGRPVWAQDRMGSDQGAVSRARLSQDGTAILYIANAYSIETAGTITRVPLDGAEPTIREVNGIHTDFVELPSGALAILGWDLRTFEDRKILGTNIVEVEPDGTERVVWSVFDDYVPDLGRYYGHWYPADEEVEDWSHVNGISYDPVDDDYYVSMTFNDGVAKVDRDTGRVVWTLDGTGGNFLPVGEAPTLAQPHSVERTDEGVLIFNRGFPEFEDSCSEATDIALDVEARTMRLVRAYTSERCLLVTFLGSASRIPNGNTLVSWTTSGQLDEVTPEGELAWRVSAAVGSGFGFATHAPLLGPTE